MIRKVCSERDAQNSLPLWVKTLRAGRWAGIKEIILCSKNRKDIGEIKEEYIKDLKFHYIDYAYEVLDLALVEHANTDSLLGLPMMKA